MCKSTGFTGCLFTSVQHAHFYSAAYYLFSEETGPMILVKMVGGGVQGESENWVIRSCTSR